MKTNLLLFLALLSFVSFGCQSTPSSTESTTTPASASSATGTQGELENLLQEALFMRGEGKFEEAQELYSQAQKADPKSAQVYYEQACNFALWDKESEALEALNKSIELGFNDAETLESEIALDELRESPDFPKLASKVIVVRPESEDAKTATVVFLHGWGDTNQSYAEELQKWAELGWIAVAVRAPDELEDGGYRWPVDDLEATKAYLDSQLEQVERQTTFLAGFSQGGSYSVQLALAYPQEFRGAVAVAPGAWEPKDEDIKLQSESPQPLFLIFGKTDSEKNAAAAKTIESAWSKKKWPLMTVAHEKGHSFPDDWQEMRQKAAEFLLINR